MFVACSSDDVAYATIEHHRFSMVERILDLFIAFDSLAFEGFLNLPSSHSFQVTCSVAWWMDGFNDEVQ